MYENESLVQAIKRDQDRIVGATEETGSVWSENMKQFYQMRYI